MDTMEKLFRLICNLSWCMNHLKLTMVLLLELLSTSVKSIHHCFPEEYFEQSRESARQKSMFFSVFIMLYFE